MTRVRVLGRFAPDLHRERSPYRRQHRERRASDGEVVGRALLGRDPRELKDLVERLHSETGDRVKRLGAVLRLECFSPADARGEHDPVDEHAGAEDGARVDWEMGRVDRRSEFFLRLSVREVGVRGLSVLPAREVRLPDRGAVRGLLERLRDEASFEDRGY